MLALNLTFAVPPQVASAATGLTVYSIPAKPFDQFCPHTTYSPEGAEPAPLTVFKAYALAPGSSGPIYYRWDFDGNGTWDPSLAANGSPRGFAIPAGSWYMSSSTDPNFDLEGVARMPKLPAGSEPKQCIATVEVAPAVLSNGVPANSMDSRFGTYPVVVRPVTDDAAGRSLRAEKAIDDGLWYLFKTQARSPIAEVETSNWGDGFNTALAVRAFEKAGFLPDGSYPARNANPYAFTAKSGLNYLGQNLMTVGVSGLPVDADGNDNGMGLLTTGGSGQCDGAAAVLAAFAGAQSWSATAPTGPVTGRTYASIAQDLVDSLSFWQYTQSFGTPRGAWFGDIWESEWPIFGLWCAQNEGAGSGVTIPAWVKSDLANWLAADQIAGGPNDGGFALRPDYTTDVYAPDARKTGFGMMGLELAGVGSTDSRMTRAQDFIARTWAATGMLGNVGNFQAMFAVSGVSSQMTPPVSSFGVHDWAAEYGDWLAGHQQVDGQWVNTYYPEVYPGTEPKRTAPAVLTLLSMPNSRGPLALAQASPATVLAGSAGPTYGTVTLSHWSSFTSEFNRDVVRYEWDFDYRDAEFTVDAATANRDETVAHRYMEPGSYTAALRVVDNSTPEKSDTAFVQITVEDVAVQFPDASLETAVRGALGIQTGDIHSNDMLGLTELNAANLGIADLSGLEHAANLVHLDLSGNVISDLAPLAGLTGLQWLALDGNAISDVSPLSGLTSGLRLLSLTSNDVVDITPLGDLAALDNLFLSDNAITDLTPLADLTGLNGLSIANNGIADITPLAGMLGLSYLDAGDNDITDITPLTELTSISWISLTSNQIADITPLAGMSQMGHLGLANNRIVDISVLKNMPDLWWVLLQGNLIQDISPLVADAGFGAGDTVSVWWDYLDITPGSAAMADVNALLARGATVHYNPQRPRPITTIVITPAAPGASGWYTTMPSISVAGQDASGVFYQWDSDGPDGWLPFVDSFDALQGQHELFTYSRNADGIVEPAHSITIKVDTHVPDAPVISSFTTPVVPANVSDASASGTAEAGTSVALVVSDGTNSLGFSTATGSDGTWSFSGLDLATLSDGAITYAVRVTDTAGNESASANADATKDTNLPPSVSVLNGTVTVNEGEVARNTGSTLDPDGEPLLVIASKGTVVTLPDGSWTWSFATSDGSDSGMVDITVFDGVKSTTASFELAVTEVAPTVSLAAAATAAEGAAYAVSGSITDPGADTAFTGTVDWGDGTIELLAISAAGFSASHAYADDGTYLIAMGVTDEDGATGYATKTVSVANVAPTITSAPNAGSLSEGGTYAGSLTFADPGADAWSVNVDWGDGTTSTYLASSGAPVDLSHSFATAGSYDVAISVSDGDGGAAGETYNGLVTVSDTIAPDAPVLSAAVDITADNVLAVPLAGTGEPGCNVSIIVTDKDGATASGSAVAGGDGSWHATVDCSGLVDGPITYAVTATDSAGNESAPASAVATKDTNLPPTVSTATLAFTENAGLTIVPTDLGSDPDGDTIAIEMVSPPTHGSLEILSDGSALYTPSPYYCGGDSFSYRLTDGSLSSETGHVTLQGTSVNYPPTANGSLSGTCVNGAPIAVTLSGADVDGDGLTYAIAVQPSHGVVALSGAEAIYTPEPGYAGPDSFAFTACDGLLTSDPAAVSLAVSAAPINTAPTITSVTGPTAPVPLGGTVTLTASFSDSDAGDAHTALFTWDDGTTSSGTIAAGVATASRIYAGAGVYAAKVTITDAAGDTATAPFEYVVVYDPSGGFATGGGWIDSPAGAYLADPSLIGKANFGFVSKYKKGVTVPTGDTEFQFHAAPLNFKSTSYDWLVVAGTKAQFKGVGTVNGSGSYKFLVTCTDGKPDRFRIKIWDAALGTTVYDNQRGALDNAEPMTALSGGSVIVHK